MRQVKVKICGLRSAQEVACAAEYGADYIGFVFAESSQRYINPAKVGDILAEAGVQVTKVGVFVNPDYELVQRCFEEQIIDIAQFHGQESEAFMMQFPQARIWRAVSVAEADECTYPVDKILVDVPGGGSGKCCNWSLAARIKRPFLLAGGLNQANILEALEQVQPWGVDLSSGLEERPGVKSLKKIREFLKEVKK